MDPLPPTCPSKIKLEDPALINHWKMESSSIDDHQPMNYFSFSNPVINASQASQSTMIQQPPSALHLCPPMPPPPSTLTFSISRQETSKMPISSPHLSKQYISFGNSKSLNPSSNHHYEMPKFISKTETEMNQMMCFESMNFSSTSSPSSLQELLHDQLGVMGYSQPIKCTRTPLQAKSHVLAERKRREKLSQRFIYLSAIVPGLKKLDKTSVIDGAINHLKQLEQRLKILEKGTKMKDDEELVLAGQKPCLCYHYEEDSSQSVKNFKTRFDNSSEKLEVKILKGDVLIRVTCKKQAGFGEGFLSEMKKLDLTVTNSKFMPFGDNMLAVSAVAQMNEGLCMTEEELANSIRQAIIKLIYHEGNMLILKIENKSPLLTT